VHMFPAALRRRSRYEQLTPGKPRRISAVINCHES
jgi:hypothetical protein